MSRSNRTDATQPRKGLIAFPFHDWHKGQREGFRTRDGHLMHEFARSGDFGTILVVDRPVSRLEHLVRRTPYRVGGTRLASRRLGRYEGALTAVGENILVLDVAAPDVLLPAIRNRSWWFDVFRLHPVIELVRWAANATNIPDAPVIAWTPTVAPLIEALRPPRLVFDSLDNWLIHPTLRRFARQAEDGYQRLLPGAAAAFASGPRSAAILSRWRPDVHVLPNGVDSALFHLPRPRPTDLPPGPIVGYAGKVATRVDTELVAAVANAMPEVAFVFVGPVLDKRSVRAIKHLSNVVLLGDRHYDEIPAYLQHFDIGWIPHRVGEGETGGDPIKLYEYWAAGKPVVSTPIDGLARFVHQLELVSSPSEVVAAIRHQLAQPLIPGVPPDREWQSIAQCLVEALAPPRAEAAS